MGLVTCTEQTEDYWAMLMCLLPMRGSDSSSTLCWMPATWAGPAALAQPVMLVRLARGWDNLVASSLCWSSSKSAWYCT